MLVRKLPVMLITIDGDDLDHEYFFPIVFHYGLLEWFVYVVYVGDGV